MYHDSSTAPTARATTAQPPVSMANTEARLAEAAQALFKGLSRLSFCIDDLGGSQPEAASALEAGHLNEQGGKVDRLYGLALMVELGAVRLDELTSRLAARLG